MHAYVEKNYSSGRMVFDPRLEIGGSKIDLLQLFDKPEEEIQELLKHWKEINDEDLKTQSWGHCSNGICEDHAKTFQMIEELLEYKKTSSFNSDIKKHDYKELENIVWAANKAVFKQFMITELIAKENRNARSKSVGNNLVLGDPIWCPTRH